MGIYNDPNPVKYCSLFNVGIELELDQAQGYL